MVVNYHGVDELKKNLKKPKFRLFLMEVIATRFQVLTLKGLKPPAPPPPLFFLSSEAIVGLQYNLRSLALFL